jgi:hypothetical protein
VFNNVLFLRGGYQNFGLPLEEKEGGLTLGAGLRYAMPEFVATFDYGWADQGRLDKTHRITLGVNF